MEEQLYCNECLSFARDPVKLNCNHTFCIACANELLKANFIHTHSMELFQCTICKQRTKVEEGTFQINLEQQNYTKVYLYYKFTKQK